MALPGGLLLDLPQMLRWTGSTRASAVRSAADVMATIQGPDRASSRFIRYLPLN
jgi:hypothetical protein